MDTNRWQEIEEVKERGDLNCGMRVTCCHNVPRSMKGGTSVELTSCIFMLGHGSVCVRVMEDIEATF